jgi:hypothetical protein
MEGIRDRDLSADAGSPRNTVGRSIALLWDQFPMPSQPCLWGDNGGDLGQNPPGPTPWP